MWGGLRSYTAQPQQKVTATFYKRAVILLATSGGPTMPARIGMVRGSNRYHVREFNSDRKPIIGESGS
jgi:hypothetical protein